MLEEKLDIYRELQKHLDKMPVGYPATESGVEIRILKHLFSPEQAELALYLAYQPLSLEKIYRKAKTTDAFRFSFYEGFHKFDLSMQEEAWSWLDQWLAK